MQELTRTLTCTLPGLENVTVTFNLMASVTQADKFIRTTAQSNNDVIVKIENWPAEHGADPWESKTTPVAWFVWALKAWRAAVKAYLEDPL